jgi:CBS-domain-containing membrane protein
VHVFARTAGRAKVATLVLTEAKGATMKVADVMSRDVYTTTEETSLRQLARELGQHGISGMPVLRDGAIVGVISETDVLAKARRPVAAAGGRLERLLHPHAAGGDGKHDAALVGEAMTAPAVTVPSYCSVATAAARMLEHGINRLPVVEGHRLAGIVTRADIVRAFARPDAAVEQDAREQVAFQQELENESASVLVKVSDGDAFLTGSVRTQDQAETLAHMVREVPGVVTLRSELTWSETT